ncbi:MAG: EamA family transporter [Bacteroidota bacterium]|jgi:drug/metabolite transporter (DMT)-like permease
MITLTMAILSSSVIFVIFKLFERFKVDVFQAIVFNYFTAFILGVGLYGHEWNPVVMQHSGWMLYAAISAMLFISLFFLMGKSAQRNGVALTSTAVKMSMAMSMLLMIVCYGEQVSLLKVFGILMAFLGVYLVSFNKEGSASEQGAHWMLIVLFVGSGLLDFLLNFVQKSMLGVLTPSLFSAVGLGLAGLMGSVILLWNTLRGRTRFAWKNLLAGVILGIPNYFSIYLLISAYRDTGWSDSTVLAVNNVSVVVLSALTGFLLFKESAGWKKVSGLVFSVAAIIVLYFAGIG